LPQLTIEEAKRLCDRLQRISGNHQIEPGDIRVKLAFGLAELASNKEENSSDLIERAIASLQN
jgi:GGDEF domain-containing protein